MPEKSISCSSCPSLQKHWENATIQIEHVEAGESAEWNIQEQALKLSHTGKLIKATGDVQCNNSSSIANDSGYSRVLRNAQRAVLIGSELSATVR